MSKIFEINLEKKKRTQRCTLGILFINYFLFQKLNFKMAVKSSRKLKSAF